MTLTFKNETHNIALSDDFVDYPSTDYPSTADGIVDELFVETVEEDEDELDDKDDTDAITVIDMFPYPDLDNDEDDFIDYPSTDDDDDDDTYSDATDADDEAFDDLVDGELELDTDPWATLSTEVRYDLRKSTC